MIVALKGDSYTTTENAASAGSLEPTGAVLGLSKNELRRGEWQWVVTQEDGQLPLETCLQLLLK